MSAKPKIVFVIAKAEIGGAEIHTMDLAAGLRTRGFATAVFAIKHGPAAARGDVLTPDERCSLPRRGRDLRRLIATERFDVAVGVNLRAMAVVAAARLGLGKAPKTAGIHHSTTPRNVKEDLVQFSHLPICHALDRFIFISENQRRYWRGRGLAPARALTILNGVDLSRFSPSVREQNRGTARAALNFAPDDVVVAMSAVFRPEKNHRQALEALARLRAAGRPVKALLIGDGPCRPAIEAQARTLDLTHDIVITGLQADVRPSLAAADVGLNCSTAIETLSLSALEMLAMGVPMAMSDIGGASEIVDRACGALFPVGELDAMSGALARFFDPEVRARAGRAARARVEAAFDQTTMFDRYAEAFALLAAEIPRNLPFSEAKN